jgi:FtsZ-interacting cell division protein ZipA
MVLIHHPDKQGKLHSQWYGLFVVANMVKPGVYKLPNEEGVKMSHTWNADNLHRFYP